MIRRKLNYVILALITSTLCASVAAYTLRGLEIKAPGSVMSKADRQKIVDILVTNPAALLSEIDVDVERALQKKKKEHLIKLMGKLDKQKKIDVGQKLKKVNEMLDRQIGYFHEGYIISDIINEIMLKNPAIVRAFHESEDKGPAEAELYHTKKEFAQAFSKLAERFYGDPVSYDDYLQLKEAYKNKPFFNLIHNIRECVGCGIARLEVPFVREYFENKVTQYVHDTFPDKNQQIIITDFASGNLFQIFVLINKLAELGYTNVRLNLIDIEFQGVIDRYKETRGAYPVQIKPGTFTLSNNDIDAIVNLSEDLEGTLTMLPQDTWSTSDVIQTIVDDTMNNNTLARFIQWFNGSNLKLQVMVYGDATDYLADCAASPSFKADLLLAVDYFTDLNHILEKLREKGLKETGMAFSLDHAEVEKDMRNAEFFYSEGSQKDPRMKHFEWDLSTKQLKPVDHLPDTLEYALTGPQLSDIFKN